MAARRFPCRGRVLLASLPEPPKSVSALRVTPADARSGARRRPLRETTGRCPTVPLLHAACSTAGPPRIAWPQAATRPAQPGRARPRAHPSLPGLADGQGSSGAASAAKQGDTTMKRTNTRTSRKASSASKPASVPTRAPAAEAGARGTCGAGSARRRTRPRSWWPSLGRRSCAPTWRWRRSRGPTTPLTSRPGSTNGEVSISQVIASWR